MESAARARIEGVAAGVQSDGQLVAQAKAGQREAYRLLVVRHERAVRALAWSVLGDHHGAEDVAQEAFVTAYQRLLSLRRGELFAAWVCRIARRLAVRAARRRKKDPAALKHEPAAAAEDAARDHHDLMRAVAGLPKRMRTLVLMTYFEDRTAAEIAQIQGCPVGTVTALLSRARRRLANRLKESHE